MFKLIAVIFIFISTTLVADEKSDIQDTISEESVGIRKHFGDPIKTFLTILLYFV